MPLDFVVKMTIKVALAGAYLQVGSTMVLKIVTMVQMRKVLKYTVTKFLVILGVGKLQSYFYLFDWKNLVVVE